MPRMRARLVPWGVLLFSLLATRAAAEADFHDVFPQGARAIPYFPTAAASAPRAAASVRAAAPAPAAAMSTSAGTSSDSPALGFTYSSSVVAQLAGSAAVIGAGFLLNDTVHPGGGEDTAVDKIGEIVGSPVTLGGGTVLFWLHGSATHDEDVKQNAKQMALALSTSYATIGVLKLTIHEERPDKSNNQSFPSGHAAGSFAVASVLDREYGGATGWIAYGMATFISATRIYGNHHELRDVVAGAVIGHFYGWLFTR